MPRRRSWHLAAVLFLMTACDDKSSPPSIPSATTPITTTSATATTTSPVDRAADLSMTVGHVRVSLKKVTIGKVPLKAADGSITYPDEQRLMIALRVENVSEKRRSEYHTWVP